MTTHYEAFSPEFQKMIDQLLVAASAQHGREMSKALREALNAFRNVSPEQHAEIRQYIAERLLSIDSATGAGFLAVWIGGAIEALQAEPHPTLPHLFKSFLRFVDAINSDAAFDENDIEPACENDRLFGLQLFGRALATHLARCSEQERHCYGTPDVFEKLEALESMSRGIRWVVTILRQRSGELLVVHAEEKIGVRVRYENITNCFHLFTLLQGALQGIMPGARTISPHQLAIAQGREQGEFNDAAWWHYDYGHVPRPSISGMIPGEASPDEIPCIEGEQVLLLWSPVFGYQVWDSGFFSPYPAASPPRVTVIEQLSLQDVNHWCDRLHLDDRIERERIQADRQKKRSLILGGMGIFGALLCIVLTGVLVLPLIVLLILLALTFVFGLSGLWFLIHGLSSKGDGPQEPQKGTYGAAPEDPRKRKKDLWHAVGFFSVMTVAGVWIVLTDLPPGARVLGLACTLVNGGLVFSALFKIFRLGGPDDIQWTDASQSSEEKPPPFFVVEYAAAIKVAAVLLVLILSSILPLIMLFGESPKGVQYDVMDGLLLFLLFFIPGSLLFLEVFLTKIFVAENRLFYQSPWRKNRTIRFHEIQSVHLSSPSECRIKTFTQGTITASDLMVRSRQLAQRIQDSLQKAESEYEPNDVQGAQSETPAEPFSTPEELETFFKMVTKYFHGGEIEYDHHRQWEVHLENEQLRISLWTLAQECAQHERQDWPMIIAEYFTIAILHNLSQT